MKLFAKKNHNHGKCSAKALMKARKYCDEKNIVFSPMRELVFKIIWSSHKSISAYELLNILKKENNKIVATTIYRALDFLESNNLIHKIHSNNTFIGCSFIGEEHIPILFVCNQCGEVGELFKEKPVKIITKNIEANNFKPTLFINEIVGTCEECQKKK